MQSAQDFGNDTGVIHIKRQSQFPYSARRFRVYIDHQQVGRIANGSSEHYTVSTGDHTVQIKIDFFKSQLLSVNVLPNQVVNLNCGQNLLSLRNYILIEQAEASSSAITSTAASAAIAVILFIILTFSLTLLLFMTIFD